jgi:hypothetical protein
MLDEVNTPDYLRGPPMRRFRACARIFFPRAIGDGAGSSGKCG